MRFVHQKNKCITTKTTILMGNYKIILDELALFEFVDELPELKENEKYFLSLVSRKKYDTVSIAGKGDSFALCNITCKKDDVVQSIKRMETAIGTYTFKGNIVENNSLVLYFGVGTVNEKKAAFELQKRISEMFYKCNTKFDLDYLMKSEIRKTLKNKGVIDFDIDDVTLEESLNIKKNILLYINESALKILKTRGGVHVLVDSTKVEAKYKNTWHNCILNNFNVDKKAEMHPMPYCTQGGFMPYFLEN